MTASILVIEDDLILNKNICRYLARCQFSVEKAYTGSEGLSKLSSFQPDIILCDYNLPDITGLEVIQQVCVFDSSIPVVIMTGAGSVEIAVNAMKSGAQDYVAKPIILKELKVLLEKTLSESKKASVLSYYKGKAAAGSGVNRIVGDSEQMNLTRSKISQFCHAEYDLQDIQAPTVLITGETGIGKDLVAKAFHYDGPRKEQPFIEINCASIPGDLLEAELFGYERGAFTDAKQRKIGLVDAADGGTLFLDEIGEMDLALQAKLLTLIENRKIRRLGSVKEKGVNVRIIAATNRDLSLLVAQGSFRSDLYYRLKVIYLHIPPLRERGNDIHQLASLFLDTHAKRYHKHGLKFSKDAYDLLLSYDWPGNVRELKNIIEQAVLLCDGEFVKPEHLMIRATQSSMISSRSIFEVKNSMNLQENEIALIKSALEQTKGNVSKAASLLGLSRDTLRYRMGKYYIGEN